MNAIIDRASANNNENLEFLSPKFAPLMPSDGTKKKRLLSQTLFSFYKDEKDPTNIASLPDLMNRTGFTVDDRDAVLDLIMEASGTRVQVEKTMEGIAGLADWQDVAKAMIEANLRMNTTWMRLLQSLTKKQQFELDTKGFAFAEPQQMHDMYFRDDAWYKDKFECDIPLNEYRQYDEGDRKHLLRRMVGKMACDTSPELSAAMRSWPKRMKQRFLAPLAFAGVVGNPTITGYVILSPQIFVANILVPLTLNIEVLSPRLFFPVILGPFLLSPRILSPRIFGVWVLSPITLSPAILRPLVLSPFILTPFTLSTAVLSPSALGGRVLCSIRSYSARAPSTPTSSRRLCYRGGDESGTVVDMHYADRNAIQFVIGTAIVYKFDCFTTCALTFSWFGLAMRSLEENFEKIEKLEKNSAILN